ncbi:unnamed protein product [Eretmochelys imbricata]
MQKWKDGGIEAVKDIEESSADLHVKGGGEESIQPPHTPSTYLSPATPSIYLSNHPGAGWELAPPRGERPRAPFPAPLSQPVPALGLDGSWPPLEGKGPRPHSPSNRSEVCRAAA